MSDLVIYADSEPMPQDGREALDAIEAMSRENDTDRVAYYDGSPGPANDGGGEAALPWYAALLALTDRDVGVDEWDAVPCAKRLFRRHTDADERELRVLELHRRRSFVESPSDGDRPADLTDKEIADAGSWEPEYRHRCRTREGRALVWREAIYDRGRGGGHSLAVRETHAVVHRTLSDDATTGPTIRGCKWCVSGQ